MSKDPFQILAEEVALIRNEIERLQRTSLNKEEAKVLHEIVTVKADQILNLVPSIKGSINQYLTISVANIEKKAVKAAESAAERGIGNAYSESLRSARSLSEAAGEARKEAWRYFGGFWVWLVSVAAVGVIVGAFTVLTLYGRGDALAFGQNPSRYCTLSGGHKETSASGIEYCVFQLGK